MNDSWKRDIRQALILLVIVGLIATVINWVRTPVLFAVAKNNKSMSDYTADKHKGVNLWDDWSHEGREFEAEGPDPGDNGDGPEIPGEYPTGGGIGEYFVIDLEKAKRLFDVGDCIFIDAREPEPYEEGHIPGAINWPYNDFDNYRQKYTDEFDRDACIVVYCSHWECDESSDVATGLVWEQFTEVYRFRAGIEEWEAYAYPVTTGVDP